MYLLYEKVSIKTVYFGQNSKKPTNKKTKKSQKDSAELLDALLDVISEPLSQEKEVNITGFGKFYMSQTDT